MSTPKKRPFALTIAGSDCSGGAGIQADLKTFEYFQAFGMSVITSVVAENPKKVIQIQPMHRITILKQLEVVIQEKELKAIKTGMLYSESIVKVIAWALNQRWKKGEKREGRERIPLIIDPVMVSSSGKKLMKDALKEALSRHLFPWATLVTPNWDEAIALLKDKDKPYLWKKIEKKTGERLAIELYKKYGCPFLVKGGHENTKASQAVDYFFDGNRIKKYPSKRIPGIDIHGTGCAYSAAITARMAQGDALEVAIGKAKKYMTQAIKERVRVGEFELLNHSLKK